MFWKQVTKMSVTAGTAEGGTTLNAFDNALLVAGIGNVNLIKVSSIVPPDVDIVELPPIKPGRDRADRVRGDDQHDARSRSSPPPSATPCRSIARRPGVIMEFHDVTDRERPRRPSAPCWTRPSACAARPSVR